MKKFAINLAKNTGAVIFWIAVWFLAAKIVAYRVGGGSELIVPMPNSVFKEMLNLTVSPEFWQITAASLLRVLIGLVISLLLGCIIAYLMSASKTLNTLIYPLMSAIKATPIASFIMIAYLWFTNSSDLPIFITALIVIPIISANVSEGISSVNKELIDVTRLYRFTPSKKLFRLYIPSIAPYFLAACKSSLGMAWKASVAAETLAITQNSIGRELYLSKQGLESARVFAWTLVTIVLSIIIEKAVILLLNKAGRKLRFLPKGEKNVTA